ncbi:S1C family serine protease [Anaerosporobacter faecicola]|uniref:S1C family serine protease n=1 Tax=Anaerosporobacter faecicola TaxID=2718714 RepID=UPI00143966DD|nr:trypsin-like peptidase domain-containing protein [Anaerosporobacter faecicola]
MDNENQGYENQNGQGQFSGNQNGQNQEYSYMNQNMENQGFENQINYTQQNDAFTAYSAQNAEPYQYQNTTYSYTKEEIPQDFQPQQGEQGYAEEHVFQITNEEKRPGKGKKVAGFIAKAAAFGLIASVTFLGTNTVYYSFNPDAKKTQVDSSKNTPSVTTQDSSNGGDSIATTNISNAGVVYNSDVSDVVDETMPSIVAITSTMTQSYNDWFGQNYEKDVEGSGSGFIVGKNDTELLIVTNNHVVAGAKAIAVQFIDEEIYQAEIKGTDSTADLAVIAVKLSDISDDTMGKIKIAKLGNSDDIKVGQMAIAIGNALGYGQSTTVGYISAKEREVTVDNNTMTLLQTDAAINPGNSGGALLNIAGEVIGINSVKYADSSVEGMGFAIPITRATPIINELMNREKIEEGEEGFLGISGGTVSSDMVQGYGWPEGVYIDSVMEGGPAAEGGVLARDIITKINDMGVASIEAMQERIFSYRAGTEVKITLKRLENGEFVEKEFMVTLKKKTDVMKEDTTSKDQSNTDSKDTNGQAGESDQQEDGNTQDPNSEDSTITDPFSEFFGDDGSFQIPGYGN